MSDTELRLLRERLDALGRDVDVGTSLPGTFKSARQLVQIYDGGSMPGTANAFYLANPLDITGTEAEGDAGVQNADTDTTIAVLVLGRPPAAGDILTAYSVGGRWVAERPGAQPVTCNWFCPPPIMAFSYDPDTDNSPADGTVVMTNDTITGVTITTPGNYPAGPPSVGFGAPETGGTQGMRRRFSGGCCISFRATGGRGTRVLRRS